MSLACTRSVLVFVVALLLAYAVIFVQRWRSGGELGGAPLERRLAAAALILLWVSFVALSAFHSYGYITYYPLSK